MKYSELKTRYKSALCEQFSLERHILSKEGLKAYFLSLEELKVCLIRAKGGRGQGSGHAMLLVKQNGNYHFYDPNDGGESPGFVEGRPLDAVVDRVFSLYGAALKFGFQGKKEYVFENLDITLAERHALPGQVYLMEEMREGKKVKTELGKDLPGLLKSEDEIIAVKQAEVVELIAAHHNIGRQIHDMIKTNGVCYGLSLVLRELLVQTGSIELAGNMLHLSLNRLRKYIGNVKMKVDSGYNYPFKKIDATSKLEPELEETLKSDRLILAMLPYFQQMQSISVRDKYHGKEMKVVSWLGDKKTGQICALPLSVMMDTPSRKAMKQLPSNPLSIYGIVKDFSEEELAEIYKNAIVDKIEYIPFSRHAKYSYSDFSYFELMDFDLEKDRECMIGLISLYNQAFLKYLPKEFREDRAFVLEVVETTSPHIFEVMDPSFQADKEIMKQIIGWAPEKIKLLDDPLMLEEEFWRWIIEEGPTHNPPVKIYIYNISAPVFKDREYLLKLVAAGHNNLSSGIYADVREDKAFIIEAVKISPKVVKYLDSDLINDSVFIFDVIQTNPECMSFLNWVDACGLLRNGDFIAKMKALKPGLSFFKDLDSKIKKDRDFVLNLMPIVRDAGLDQQKEFVLEVVCYLPEIVEHMDESFRMDEAFMLELIQLNDKCMHELVRIQSDLIKRKSFVLEVIRTDISLFQYAAFDLKEDKEFVLALVAEKLKVLECVNVDFLSDAVFMLNAIKKDSRAYTYLEGDLSSSSEFLLKAIECNIDVLKHVGENWLNDQSFMIRAALIDEGVLDYAPDLKKSTGFHLRLKAAKLSLMSFGSMWDNMPSVRGQKAEASGAMISEDIDGFVLLEDVSAKAGPAPDEDTILRKDSGSK